MILLDQVSKTYDLATSQVHALRDVSLEIAAGAFAFVLGPSGSGKSTLLYVIGALDQPTKGQVKVDGRQIDQLPRRERNAFRRDEVGFVFQNFNLLNNLCALDNVLVPFLPGGISSDLRDRATALLEEVGLGNRLDHRPSQLSGGEQQRVALARALLKQPKLVLADEPAGELDSVTGAEVFGYLRKLQQQHGATVVVVTHNERYLEPDDLVIRLADGRIVG